jgi:DHA1 family bicyclomycin/chloramphenicol resistance-like MFS transporter
VTSRLSRRLVVVLAMFVATVPFALDMYLPALPGIAADLRADAGAAAHTVSAFLFGLALGQFLLGPLSDRHGRRRVLALSLVIFTAASAACALATGVAQLVALRVIQALGCGAAAVIVNALIRDLYDERMSASVMSVVFMVMLTAPLVAPVLGGYVLAAGGWRAIFWLLVLYGVVCLYANARWLPADLGGGGGRPISTLELARAYARVLTHREAMGYNLASGFAGAVLFAFITGSSFFYIEVYGVAPTHFGYLFAANVVTLMVFSNLNRRLVHAHGVRTLILAGCIVQVVASSVLALGVWSGVFGLAPTVAGVAFAIGSMGFIGANGTSAMLGYFPGTAGTTAAVGGISRFLFGALAGSAVGVMHDSRGVAMVSVMAACAIAGLTTLLTMTRRRA